MIIIKSYIIHTFYTMARIEEQSSLLR